MSVLLWCIATSAIPAQNQQHPRNLQEFDFGGKLTLDFAPGAANGADVTARVRAFIWKHFKEKKRGYIIFRAYTAEGEPNETTYYIEPDEHGNWRVYGTIHRVIRQRKFPFRQKADDIDFKAYQLQRVTPGPARLSKVLPDDMRVDDKSYRLRMADASGATLDVI